MHNGTLARLGVIAALALIPAGEARADPVYSINATALSSAQGIDVTVSDSSGTALQSVFSSPNAPAGTSTGFTQEQFGVIAQPGIIGASSSVTSAGGSIGSGGLVLASSSMVLDNILITGGPAGMAVVYTVNFNITGSITVDHVGPAALQGGVQLSDSGTDLGDTAVLDPATPGIVGSGTGIFARFPETDSGTVEMSVAGTTPAAPGVVGTDAVLGLTLLTSANVSTDPHESGQVTVDFQDPFSFPTTGPVMNFFDPVTGAPLEGITANSSDGCIVENRFVCGTTPVSSVPEPNAGGLVVLALALFGLVANRRTLRSWISDGLAMVRVTVAPSPIAPSPAGRR